MAQLTATIRISDHKPVKNIISQFTFMLNDERIPKDIRDEYILKIQTYLDEINEGGE